MENTKQPSDKSENEVLPLCGVVESAMTEIDLIAFAKWVDDKFYTHTG